MFENCDVEDYQYGEVVKKFYISGISISHFLRLAHLLFFLEWIETVNA